MIEREVEDDIIACNLARRRDVATENGLTGPIARARDSAVLHEQDDVERHAGGLIDGYPSAIDRVRPKRQTITAGGEDCQSDRGEVANPSRVFHACLTWK